MQSYPPETRQTASPPLLPRTVAAVCVPVLLSHLRKQLDHTLPRLDRPTTGPRAGSAPAKRRSDSQTPPQGERVRDLGGTSAPRAGVEGRAGRRCSSTGGCALCADHAGCITAAAARAADLSRLCSLTRCRAIRGRTSLARRAEVGPERRATEGAEGGV